MAGMWFGPGPWAWAQGGTCNETERVFRSPPALGTSLWLRFNKGITQPVAAKDGPRLTFYLRVALDVDLAILVSKCQTLDSKPEKSMAKNLQRGESIYVPLNRLGIDRSTESAFLHTSVLAIEPGGRSVIVDLLDNGDSAKIASSAVHRNVGVFILCIGDIDTESTLLEPLRKSVLQYFRLLLPHPALKLSSVRSKEELSEFWRRDHSGYSHVVLLGHGSEQGLEFAIGGCLGPRDLGALFAQHNASRKHFLSLCCQTGKRAFAKAFCDAFTVKVLLDRFIRFTVQSQASFYRITLAIIFLLDNRLRWLTRERKTIFRVALVFDSGQRTVYNEICDTACTYQARILASAPKICGTTS